MGSLGAGLSVAVAASVMLLVVSTVVAFRGWPDDLGSSSGPVSRLVSGVASDSGSATATSDRLSPLNLPAASSPAAAPTHRSRTPRSGDRGGASPATSSSPATTGINTSAPSTTGSGGSSGSSGQVGDTLSKVTAGAGGTVTGTTKTAADVARPVAPTVGDTIDRTGASVGTTVDNTGDAVAQALSQIGH